MICLMEELSEMQHAASKCLRFGPSDVCKESGIENIKKVENELADVFAVLSLLGSTGFPIIASEENARKKSDKLLLQINKAIDAGIIEGISEEEKQENSTLIVK
jgi:hypothetical protein